MTGSTKVEKGLHDRPDQEHHADRKANNQQQDGMSGFLGWIEKVGNKLPDPFWLFVILAGVVAVSSWLASKAGLSAATRPPVRKSTSNRCSPARTSRGWSQTRWRTSSPSRHSA